MSDLREQYERFAGFVYGVAETEVRVYDGARPDASMTLARLVEEAQRLLAQNPHIPERPAPFDDWTDRERENGVHEAVAEVERRNREKFGTPEILTALESLNERIDVERLARALNGPAQEFGITEDARRDENNMRWARDRAANVIAEYERLGRA